MGPRMAPTHHITVRRSFELDYQRRIKSGLRQQADEEAMDQTSLELGPWPEDPTHYALKPALGGLVLILLTSTILT